MDDQTPTTPQSTVESELTPARHPGTAPGRLQDVAELWRSFLGDLPIVRKVVSIVLVLGTTLYAAVQVHIDKVFLNNTPTGGDMGAHVWAPAFLRDFLLPKFRIQGWSMDWYAGLPVYRFYMLPPALLMTDRKSTRLNSSHT